MVSRQEVINEFRQMPEEFSLEDFWDAFTRILEEKTSKDIAIKFPGKIQREILYQTYVRGFTSAQIAQNLGLSVQVVGVMRHRTLQQLRIQLSAPKTEETLDQNDWNRLTADEFLSGYSESDSIYDDL